jgi:DNA-directed RNA polymerase specialized sigma24 family protein
LDLGRCREELLNRIIEENKVRLVAISRSYADSLSQDDLYQEILARIWRSLGTFAGRSKLNTWVLPCCHKYRAVLPAGTCAAPAIHKG